MHIVHKQNDQHERDFVSPKYVYRGTGGNLDPGEVVQCEE